jgi:sensor domain CHASE-containing protein
MGAARSVLLLGCGALAGAWACAPSLRRRAGARAAEAEAAQRRLDRLRHDLRGALSPALLSADRLLASDDPATRHAGEIIVRAVDRATAMMDATRAASPTEPGDTA